MVESVNNLTRLVKFEMMNFWNSEEGPTAAIKWGGVGGQNDSPKTHSSEEPKKKDFAWAPGGNHHYSIPRPNSQVKKTGTRVKFTGSIY